MPSAKRLKSRTTGKPIGKWLIRWKDERGVWTDWSRTSAPDEKAAYKLAQQREWECEEIHDGRRLPIAKAEDEPTVAEICRGYLRHRYPRAEDRYDPEKQIVRHILDHAFGQFRLSQVDKLALMDHWANLSEDLEDGTLNRIRTTLLSSFTWAEEYVAAWKGRANPVLKLKPKRIYTRDRVTLRDDQYPIFLANVPEEWQEFFATALWLALRKGELCGLLKSDINIPDRIVTISRSYDKKKPKGGDAAALPIPETLVPFLESAMARSNSRHVFPARNGRMRTRDCNPEKILRTALKRAGLVRGYNHVCRRCKGAEMKRRREAEGANFKALEKERREKDTPEPATYFHEDPAPRDCPECKMRLWPRAEPIEMNFHSVRHTAITLLLRAGVPAAQVQRIARHASIVTTTKTYGHLQVEDLRKPMEALPTLPVGFGAPVGHSRKPPHRAPATTAGFANDDGGFADGPYWFRTSDPYRVKKVHPVTTGYQAGTTALNDSDPENSAAQTVDPFAPNIDVFGTPVGHSKPALRALPMIRRGLLNIAQVADILGISTATVRKLFEKGEIVHGRISNAYRVDPSDLEAYIARSKGRVE